MDVFLSGLLPVRAGLLSDCKIRPLHQLLGGPPVNPHQVASPLVKHNSVYLLRGDAFVSQGEAPTLEMPVPPRTMHSVMLCLGGRATVQIWAGGAMVEFEPRAGELLMLPAQEALYVRQTGQMRFFKLSIAPHRLLDGAAAERAEPALPGLPLRVGLVDDVLRSLLTALYEARATEADCPAALIAGVVQAVCAHLRCRYCQGLPPLRFGLPQAALDLIERHLQERGYQGVALGEVAQLLGMSALRLQREIKARTGLSFSQLARDLRLHAARNALVERRASVTDAAFQFGFADTSHFSRSFTKRFGIAPSRLLR